MRARIVYSLIFFGLLCNTYIFNSQTSQGLLALVIILPILSFTISWISTFYLAFTFTSEEIEVERNSQFNCQLAIKNSSVLILPFIEVLVHSANGINILIEKGLQTSIDSKETVRVSLPCKAIARGLHLVELEKVFVIDYLGLFRVPVPIKQQDHCKVSVMPRLLQYSSTPSLPLDHSKFRTMLRSSSSVRATVIKDNDVGEEIREFRQGDSMRSIHWKLYSKTNELMVRSPEKSNSNSKTNIVTMLPWISTTDTTSNIGIKDVKPQVSIAECEDILIEALLAIVKNLLSKGNIIKLLLYSKNAWNLTLLSSEKDIYQLQIFLSSYQFENSDNDHSKTNVKNQLKREINNIDEISILEAFDDGTTKLNNKVVNIR